MWYLNSEHDNRIIYILPDKHEIVIGRSPDAQICDFTIHEDASISRRHAMLVIQNNELFVKDLGSRYGTFINNSTEKIVNDATHKLENNDIVKFGKMKCVWTVHEIMFITCTSTLKGENLYILKHVLSKIGGELKSDWDDSCEYLTMPAITLTIKVVLALVQGSYIVTTDFWSKCLDAINTSRTLPNPKNFRPDIVESTLNKDLVSFLPDKRRLTLFAGKKFVFFSKRQYDMYKAVLIKGNATPILLSESQMSKASLCDDNVVVIQYNLTSASQETEAQKSQITETINYLKSNGKRLVADPEIGLAVLHCNITKYCNPSFNFSSEVVKEAPAQSTNKILAPETQDNFVHQTKRENVIINESLLSNDGNSSKRKFNDMNDDDFSTNANKKMATSTNITGQSINESHKRKHEGEDNLNPTKKLAMDNDDEMFNFVTPASSESTAIGGDKLNLAKPQKRKVDAGDDEDDLFNFVQTDRQDNDAKRMMFDTNQNEESTIPAKKLITPEEISAMRGSKLAELNSAHVNWNENIVKNIKKEDESLDEQMNQLDIGSVVVIVNDSLIVKKEPIELEDSERPLQNFKKFKKVWPVRRQVTVIPKSSMILVGNDDGNQSNMTNNSA